MLPKGKLVCTKNGKYYKWYKSNKHNLVYIPKTQKAYASLLADRKYLEIKLKQLESKQKYLKRIMQDTDTPNKEMISLLKNPGICELISESLEVNDKAWMQEMYETNPFQPEKCIHKSVNGIKTRSKSESLIAIVLANMNISFRYECVLEINGKKFYPDFTIMKKDGTFLYWEHLGMMDTPSYVSHNIYKIQEYINNGIIPGQNLILTFETNSCPLSYEAIEKIIEVHIL